MPLPRHLRSGLSRAELGKLTGQQILDRVAHFQRIVDGGKPVPLQEEDSQAELARLDARLHLHLGDQAGPVHLREVAPSAPPAEDPEMRRLSSRLHEHLGGQ